MKLAVLREHVRGPAPFFSESVFCSLEETGIKSMLDAVVERHPEVEVGSYPKWFDPTYKTRVTFDSRTATSAALAASEFKTLLGSAHVVVDVGQRKED